MDPPMSPICSDCFYNPWLFSVSSMFIKYKLARNIIFKDDWPKSELAKLLGILSSPWEF